MVIEAVFISTIHFYQKLQQFFPSAGMLRIDTLQSKMIALQETLSSLSLDFKEETEAEKISEYVLLRKLLASKLFRRFSVAEIIEKNWYLKDHVKVEKIDNFLFKLYFSCK